MNPQLCSSGATAVAAAMVFAACAFPTSSLAKSHDQDSKDQIIRAAAPSGAIDHILVIDLENENFSVTFGPSSPAVYLNSTLLSQGQLIVNYFATSHVSLGNYLSQVSGQGPTESINNDCINLGSLAHPPVLGGFTDVVPGTDAEDEISFQAKSSATAVSSQRPPWSLAEY